MPVPLCAAIVLTALACAGTTGVVPATDGRAPAAASAGIAGLPPLPAWRTLYEAARRRHVLWGEAAFPQRAEESEAPPPPPALLAPPALLREVIADAPAADEDLPASVLASRRAALVYRGLAGLDEATLAALSSSPGLVKRIGECCADAFAAFGGRLRVRDARVEVPGSVEAWEALVGEPVASPSTFLPALLGQGGRRACLLATLARLDPARVRFAIGPDGPAQVGGLQRLAAVFDREPVWWGREVRGYGRDDADAASVLDLVRVDDAGVPLAPRTIAFWQAVFEGGRAPTASAWTARVAASRPFDAAWIAGAVRRGAPDARRTRLAQVAFGQRVFGDVEAESLVDAVVAVQALADRPGLVLALERLGVREPGVYAAGLTAARAAREPALLEAALAVLERARFARTIDAAQATQLVRSLVALRWADEAAQGKAAAAWIHGSLVPALGGTGPSALDAEEVLLRAMAGSRPAAATPVVEWEGSRHRVDAAAGELARMRRVRERQGGERLDATLDACDSRGASCVGGLRATLASIVYAAHLGPADGPALAGEDPSRRHELGARPWALPEEERDAKGAWRLRGALLGLDQPLALLALRRPERDALPENPPLFGPAQRGLLAAATALLNPFDLRDEDRDALAGAIARGRARVEALAAGSADTARVAAASALDPWRASALRWVLERDPPARRSFFSLLELLELGREGGSEWREWGGADPIAGGPAPVPPRARPFDASDGRPPERSLARGFADLNLRVAVFLSERGLPASLAPFLVKRLLPGLVDEARPVAADDRLALEDEARRTTDAAIEDAVASLVGDGPLRPLGRSQP